MEIRTCEEYVVAELLDAKNEIENLKSVISEVEMARQETVNKLDSVMKTFQELKDMVCKISNVDYTSNDCVYIRFSSVYSNWDKEDYDKLVELVPSILEKPQKVNATL